MKPKNLKTFVSSKKKESKQRTGNTAVSLHNRHKNFKIFEKHILFSALFLIPGEYQQRPFGFNAEDI